VKSLLEPGSFFGFTTASSRVAGMTLTEGRYPPHARIPPHAHSSPYVCLVLGGWYDETTTGRTERCVAGTVVYHPSDEEHADCMGTDGARCFNLELSPTLMDGLEQEGRLPQIRTALGPGRATALGISLRLQHCAGSGLTELNVEETLLGLLAELWRRAAPGPTGTRRPPWLARALERLRESAAPSVTELAAEAGLHPVYFTRAFRAAVRMPPSRFVVEARLERASGLLVSSQASVSAIAYEVGYSDHSHFCRQFRRRFGITPSAYRSGFS
jgi:AraC family transcriptional regulator